MIEADNKGDGGPETGSTWWELNNGENIFRISGLNAVRWRIKLLVNSIEAGSPKIYSVMITS